METRLRIRVGTVELEYEGSESFLKDAIPGIVETVAELVSGLGVTAVSQDGAQLDPEGLAPAPVPLPKKLEGTTATIAAKLKVSSGPDLIMAAAARLRFVSGVEKASRKDLLAEMQSATAYYVQTFSKNLSYYLSSLVKAGKLSEVSKGTYSICALELERLEGVLQVV